ncbi:hypothetical protein [Rhodoferax sp.]|uniref:hypothetical protein n=1 Tax=Rhodoferax sp. TaxID=50421 RepID=UPI00284BB9A6|nr:hypothetical protein [Rhodoferax sp.]MDR3369024.1 hypothetical protein [Rhodoferax sp.]
MKLPFHTASHLGAILPQEISLGTLFTQTDVSASLTGRETMGNDVTLCGQSTTSNEPLARFIFFKRIAHDHFN